MADMKGLKELWDEGFIFMIGGAYGYEPWEAEDWEEVLDEIGADGALLGKEVFAEVDYEAKEVYFEYE